MSPETHRQLADFIWKICDRLRGPYRRNEYRKVILPLTVLRRFDSVLAPTRAAVLERAASIPAGTPDSVRERLLAQAAGEKLTFYNTSKFDFQNLLDDPNQLAMNLVTYIHSFSPNVRTIIEKFSFEEQIDRMAGKNLLFEVMKAFAAMDLSPQRVDNVQMGYIFEELIRIGSEQANEEAGDHFTPREVIKLMVNLLLSPEQDLARSRIIKTIYDPACGTGGMLSVAEQYIRDLNQDAHPILYGQDYNDESWAICKSDMLIKGEEADNIILGDTFTQDAYTGREGRPGYFDYMLANPPFGVEWKQQQSVIERERDSLGHQGRFGAGTPRINDGALLFLQHMLSKRQPVEAGGSRIAIVFNGSPLFTGDAGSGESEIRRWIIENDWLEAIVALPDQLFYNTGISTYIWILTNRKEERRLGKVQLIDARNYFVKMRKSLGNKRNKIGEKDASEPDHIGEVTRIHGDFLDGDSRTFVIDGAAKSRVVSKVFDNADFGYRKITVERPLRLNFQATPERIARIEDEAGFRNLATSKKKDEKARLDEIAVGEARQQELRDFLAGLAKATGGSLFTNREAFTAEVRKEERSAGLRLAAPELKAILSALSERNETADICRSGRDERPEPDSELRDTENVPLTEEIEDYVQREVLPHVPDAWVDPSKTKVGYEIPFNRHFYVYEPPRPLEEIEADIKTLEGEILALLSDVTGSKPAEILQ